LVIARLHYPTQTEVKVICWKSTSWAAEPTTSFYHMDDLLRVNRRRATSKANGRPSKKKTRTKQLVVCTWRRREQRKNWGVPKMASAGKKKERKKGLDAISTGMSYSTLSIPLKRNAERDGPIAGRQEFRKGINE